MRRQIKTLLKGALGILHRTALKVGLVVIPNHYYSPVADVYELRRSSRHWARRSSLIGIDMNIDRQAAFLRDRVKPYEAEYRGNRPYRDAVAGGFGPGYGNIEAQCLHGVLRSLKPRRIVEVGSGSSTYCTLHAIALNALDGHEAEITCIEPHPSEFLRKAGNGKIKLVEEQVQKLDPDFFLQLEAGDFLFIDSTHAIKPGGDVLFLYLEVIPRLQPGVVVHIHDIFFPYLYQRDLLTTLFQWSETAMLQALLTENNRIGVLLCQSQMHYDAPEVLLEVFPDYRQQNSVDGLCDASEEGEFPASIFLRIEAPEITPT